jgi:hypothetical protein
LLCVFSFVSIELLCRRRANSVAQQPPIHTLPVYIGKRKP